MVKAACTTCYRLPSKCSARCWWTLDSSPVHKRRGLLRAPGTGVPAVLLITTAAAVDSISGVAIGALVPGRNTSPPYLCRSVSFSWLFAHINANGERRQDSHLPNNISRYARLGG